MGGWVLALVATVVWMMLLPGRWERRILIFPDTLGAGGHYEYRLVPQRNGSEEKIEILLDELLLGPVQIGAVPFLPRDSSFNSVVLDRGIVYVDITEEVLFGPETGRIAFEDSLDLIRRNLRLNFPWLKEIVVTIAGSVPGVAPFRLNNGMTLTKQQPAL
jgi:hypothetical protein